MAWNVAGEEPDGAADVDTGLRQDKKHSGNAVLLELSELVFVAQHRINAHRRQFKTLTSGTIEEQRFDGLWCR